MTLGARFCFPKLITLSILSFPLIIATSCGGGSSVETPKPPVTISTAQGAATLNAGSSTSFSATVINSSNTAVSWSVQEGASGGTITSAGVYTAPVSVGTYHVIATALSDPTKTASITITVIPPLSVSIAPTSTVTLGPAQSQSFTATVTNSVGGTAVTWSVRETSGGSISSAGVYTAPTNPGTYHVVATAQVDNTKTATATIAVVPVSITVSTAMASMLVGQSHTFGATVNYANNTTVIWSVQESSGGSITSDGVYTAPVKAGIYHVSATSAADSSKSATITVTVDGMITTFAGHGTAPYPGDGVLATDAQLGSPSGITFDESGNLYISDGFRVRKVDAAAGIITTVAGTGTQGTTGDGGPATSAQLYGNVGVAVDQSGNLYIGDFGWVREVNASTAIIDLIAGRPPFYGYSGDGGPAIGARFFDVTGIKFDPQGNLLVADMGNQRIRVINASTAIVTTYAGNGIAGYSGDNGPATSAMLAYPYGIAFDQAGNLYIADTLNNVIRKIAAADGVITTVAGTGTTGYSGDGGPATSATFYQPHDVVVDSDGNLFIADTYNNVVRKVAASTGIITTVAGNGTPGYSGDFGVPTAAQLKNPWSLAIDASGNLYVAELGNGVIRKVQW